jgi:putative intracellular protease/amidase
MRGGCTERSARSVGLFEYRSDLARFPLDAETGGAGGTTRPVAELSADAFDAIVVADGQAPMFTFEGATELQRLFVAFFEAGKVTAALCHGVALLRYARLSTGELLAKGPTGFANVEEDFADNTVWEMGALPRGRHLMPWRIEDEMRALGANYVQAGLWRDFAVRDGNLITGQQNFS